MEGEPKPSQPIISEYQGKPINRIPTVENPNPDTTWHWLSFGKNKARLIRLGTPDSFLFGNPSRETVFERHGYGKQAMIEACRAAWRQAV